MKTDEQIQKDVMEELKWEPSVNPAEIGVSVKHGVVTLSGCVNFYPEKLAAEKAARRVQGVKAVAEDIEVRLTEQGKLPDSKIAESVVRALEWNATVPDDRIKVRVERGWVYLDGTVDFLHQKEAAERAIRYLTGIRGVSNLINVVPKVSSDNVRENIRKTLERRAIREADKVSIEMMGNKVILRGSARSWNERKEIERAASAAPGVETVDDQLVVVP